MSERSGLSCDYIHACRHYGILPHLDRIIEVEKEWSNQCVQANYKDEGFRENDIWTTDEITL